MFHQLLPNRTFSSKFTTISVIPLILIVLLLLSATPSRSFIPWLDSPHLKAPWTWSVNVQRLSTTGPNLARTTTQAARVATPELWVPTGAEQFSDQICGHRPPYVDKVAYVGLNGQRPMSAVDLFALIQGRRLLLIGDSLTQHTMNVLLCDLADHGHRGALKVGEWYYGDSTADFQKEQNLTAVRLLETRIGSPFEVTIGYLEGYTLPEAPGLPSWKGYTLWPTALKRVVGGYDLVAANLGLHYLNTPAESSLYQQHLQELMGMLKSFNEDKCHHAWFRETTPQFFPSTDSTGAFEDRVKGPECLPADNITSQNWRNMIARDEAEEAGVQVQAVFEAMALPHLAKYHERTKGESGALDCTHFLMVPEVWAPMIDSLYYMAQQGVAKLVAEGCQVPLGVGFDRPRTRKLLLHV